MNLLSDLSRPSLEIVHEKKTIAQARRDGYLAKGIHGFNQQVTGIEVDAFGRISESIQTYRPLPFRKFCVGTQSHTVRPVSKVIGHIAGTPNILSLRKPRKRQCKTRNEQQKTGDRIFQEMTFIDKYSDSKKSPSLSQRCSPALWCQIPKILDRKFGWTIGRHFLAI